MDAPLGAVEEVDYDTSESLFRQGKKGGGGQLTEPGIPPLASPLPEGILPAAVVVEDLDMVVGVVIDLDTVELVMVDMDMAEVDPPASPPEEVMLNC